MIEVRESDVFKAWFARLRDQEARARIRLRIRRLSAGNPGDVKPVGKGVSENADRLWPTLQIYSVQRGKTVVILLCGGDKRTQVRDIARAIEMAQGI
jgi:putative addiction module killer protein